MKNKSSQQKFIIGLTGGIGSGKTTVSNVFHSLGIDVVDADKIAKQLVISNSPTLKTIAEHFGQDILTENSELNRPLLRTIIFNDKSEKDWLENLLHPLIRQKISRAIEASTSVYIILAAPLLLESQHYSFVNRILVIDTEVALQIHRSSKRDNTNADDVKKIITAQISREDRLEQADDVIKNTLDIDSLKSPVLKLHQQYLQQAKEFHNYEH